jgi:phosphate transport system substrate-binding protein
MRTMDSWLTRFVLIGVLLPVLFWLIPARTPEPPVSVTIDGSSTVYPITEAAVREFQNGDHGAVRVTVGISGTGGGFKKFCRGETDVQNASRPILPQEMAMCREHEVQYVELPLAFDAITLVVSVQNTWVDYLTIDELRRIWEPSAEGRLTRWRQIRPTWPDLPLKLFGAGSDSGTFDYFSEVVVGTAKASRGDYTASEDDNTLIQGISGDPQALGYVPLAYYHANARRLRPVPVDSGDGPIRPSAENVESERYVPLSRPVFLYVNRQAADRQAVREFIEFYLKHATSLVMQAGYVPLPPRIHAAVRERYRVGTVGSVYQGIPLVGFKVEDVLQRQPKL